MGNNSLQSSCQKFLKICKVVSMCWLVFLLCLSVWGWYALDIFCFIFNSLQMPLKICEVNLISLSEITHSSNPTNGNAYSKYSLVMLRAPMSSLQGNKITTFVQSWSVTVSMESYPLEIGSLTIKSIAIVKNDCAHKLGKIGCRGGWFGWVFALLSWHLPHSWMYFYTKSWMLGHQ